MAQPTHQPPVGRFLAAVTTIMEALDDARDVQPLYMGLTEKADALVGLQRAMDRVEELRLRVLADAGDLAADTGHRDQAQWLAHHAGVAPEKARADLRLAKALERHPVAGAGLRDGWISYDQTLSVIRALAKLPDDLPADTETKAEEALVRQARALTPKQIGVLGQRILELVAPDEADAIEGKRLEQQEREARAKVKLTMKRLGHGLTRISAVVSDVAADRLVTYLDAFTNPRKETAPIPPADPHPLQKLPYPHRAGLAFQQFLEAVDPQRLPIHGGDATTLIVTMTLDQLRTDLATAGILSHARGAESEDQLSASEARRLACTANIIPAVLGGHSEILDFGHTRRLHNTYQRKAMAFTYRTCVADGCDVPAAWCESHHVTPWSKGGRTSVADGRPLCSHHHHLIHDPTYRHEWLASGLVVFYRLT